MTIAAALEREHRDIDGCVEAFLDDPAGAADVLRTGLAALRRHIYLEEAFLFPPLRAAGPGDARPGDATEHGQLWRLMTAYWPPSIGVNWSRRSVPAQNCWSSWTGTTPRRSR